MSPRRLLDPSRATTRLALIVTLPLALLLGARAVTSAAAQLKAWRDGDTLTAVDINANFSALQAAVDGAAVPSGAVMAFDLDACPSGWSPFEAARGRAVVGVNAGGNGLSVRARGQTLGAETRTLSVQELPAHAHAHALGSLTVTAAGAHQHALSCNYITSQAHGHFGHPGSVAESPEPVTGVCNPPPVTASSGAHTHALIGGLASEGAGRAFDVLPPSVVLLYTRRN